ncbi:MAG: hypothetical protein J5822_04195, partial [Eubacteriaceae bacterium]|nr:hypothetical protein [Eubacteriaceae bacterium]
CIGILAALIVLCLAVLIPVRLFTELPSFVFRKLLHVIAVSGVTLMIILSPRWQAAAATSAVIALACYPLLTVLEQESWFSTMFVQKSPGEIKRSLLLLMLMFTAVISLAWGLFGRMHLAASAIIMWGAGDAAAALVGIPFGRHKIICRFTDGKKSREGSIAMFIVSFAAGLSVLMLTEGVSLAGALLSAAAGAVAGTAAELFTPGEYDTFTVPLAVLAVLLIMG